MSEILDRIAGRHAGLRGSHQLPELRVERWRFEQRPELSPREALEALIAFAPRSGWVAIVGTNARLARIGEVAADWQPGYGSSLDAAEAVNGRGESLSLRRGAGGLLLVQVSKVTGSGKLGIAERDVLVSETSFLAPEAAPWKGMQLRYAIGHAESDEPFDVGRMMAIASRFLGVP